MGALERMEKAILKELMLGKSIIKMLPLTYPTKSNVLKKAFKPLNIIQKFQIRGKNLKIQGKEVALKLVEKPENRN